MRTARTTGRIWSSSARRRSTRLAGLRIDEALSLRWRDVNLPSRTLKVGQAKTDAGTRTIDMRTALLDELLETGRGAPGDRVFATASGGKLSASNVRNRVLAPAVEIANAALDEAGHPPLPYPMTPHSLRRTFISVLLALGAPVPYVMEQAGHTDPKVTLGVYARVMRRSEDERRRLRMLVDGERLDVIGIEIGLGGDLPLERYSRLKAVELPHEEVR
jgi:integrase